MKKTWRLQKKDELHYRAGSTNESRNCQYCKHFVDDYIIVAGNGDYLRSESRCKLLGLEQPASFRVRDDYRCDAQEFDISKARWLQYCDDQEGRGGGGNTGENGC